MEFTFKRTLQQIINEQLLNGNHSKNINIDSLMKVRGHLDKTEKRKQEIKQKKLPAFSGNSCLKKMVFEQFN